MLHQSVVGKKDMSGRDSSNLTGLSLSGEDI